MASVSFSASINLNNGTIALTDTSDLVSQGVALIDANGNFKITAPSGNVIYQNSSYYFETGTAQSGSTTTLRLAAGATSLPLAGAYILATGGAGSGQVARIATYNTTTKLATFVTPVGVAFDNTTTYRICVADIFLAANLTNQFTISLYSGNTIEQGTYTIDYLVYDSNLGEFYATQSQIDYTYTLPTVEIVQTVDCLSPLLTSVDATNYTLFGGIQPDSLTRTHTIIYPPSTGVPNVVGNTANLYTSILYNNGTYTTTLSVAVSWTLPDGTVINATLTGSQEILVKCEQWICDVYCCLKSIYNLWQGYINTNQTLAAQYQLKWQTCVGLSEMIQAAYQCGDSNAVTGYVNTLRTIANCNENCQCDDGTIQLIQGLGNITNTYALNELTPAWLDVTTTVSGNSTTWGVGLTAQAITALTSGNVVTPDTNTKVTVTGTGSTASYAVKGATVSAANNSGVRSTFTGGTTNPDYALAIRNLLKDQLEVVPTTTTGSFEELMAYNMPSGTLSSDGDSLDIEGWFDCTPNSAIKKCKVAINNTPIFGDIFLSIPQHRFAVFNIKVVRKSATQIGYTFNVSVGNETYPSVYSFVSYDTASAITINNLGTNSNKISLDAGSAVAGDVSAVFFQVKLNKV